MIGYNTPQNLIDYALARGVVISVQDAPILLTKALDFLSVQNIEFSNDPVPAAIVTAQLVTAMIYNSGGDPMEPIGRRVTQETVVGAVSVSYSNTGNQTTLYPQLIALLAPYRIGPGGNFFGVRRG